MKEPPSPIILGRRNCRRCTRWKLAIEFNWRWPKHRVTTPEGSRIPGKTRGTVPKIDSVCAQCRRELERQKYAKLPPEKKEQWIKRAVESKRKQRQAAEDERALARLALAENRRLKYELTGLRNGNRLPFIPFRMWLIQRQRELGTEVLARRIGYPQTQVEQWLAGFVWDNVGNEWNNRSTVHCEPQPIYSIHIDVVDRALLGEGTTSLETLYPQEDE